MTVTVTAALWPGRAGPGRRGRAGRPGGPAVTVTPAVASVPGPGLTEAFRQQGRNGPSLDGLYCQTRRKIINRLSLKFH